MFKFAVILMLAVPVGFTQGANDCKSAKAGLFAAGAAGLDLWKRPNTTTVLRMSLLQHLEG